MIKEIYLELIDRLKSKDADFTAIYSKINHYDLFFSQYSEDGLLIVAPFELPAVFFEISADFTAMGKKTQQAQMLLRVHVVQENYKDTDDRSNDQSLALTILDFVDMVNTSLHGFKIDKGGTLLRTRLDPETSPSNLYTYIISYQFTADDNSTNAEKSLINSAGNHPVKVDPSLLEPFNTHLIAKNKIIPPLPSYFTLD